MSALPGEGRPLERVLFVMRPLVRFLVRHGIGYGALAIALKRIFLDEARRELRRRDMAMTDSALSLLSGLHRHNVRSLAREQKSADAPVAAQSPGVAVQVVARWINGRRWRDRQGRPRLLPRGPQGAAAESAPSRSAGASRPPSFDELVRSVSRDVRPRAVLDELVRLGVAEERPEGVRLLADAFVPRGDADAMGAIFAANLHDHCAAAVANMLGDARFVELAVYVDEISPASAAGLQEACKTALNQALHKVHAAAQAHHQSDLKLTAPERSQRARCGVYFYAEPMQ